MIIHFHSDKIFRYDCRGYLQDLSVYDADNVVQTQGNLTDEEMATEEMCNYERYLELRTDVHEEEALKGEWAKDNLAHDAQFWTFLLFGLHIAAKIASL